MIVSTTDADLNYIKKIKSKNFICVNTDSNLVIKSEFNLIYSIYSKKYQTLNSELENNVFYPLILYKRTYEVEKQSYKKIFDFIQHYRKKKKLALILGLTGLFVFLIAGILLIIFHIKFNKEKDNSMSKPLLRTTLDSQNDDVKVNEVQD